MNKSISISTPVLWFPLPLTRMWKHENKDWKAISLFLLRSSVFSLALLRHPPVCISLTLSLQPFSVCILRVCARICVPSVYFGNPGGFGPTPRSLNALWHGEALRPGDRQRYPAPFFFNPPSLPSLPLSLFLPPPPHPNTLPHIHKHTHNPTLSVHLHTF